MIIARRATIFSMKEGNENFDYIAVTALLKSQMIPYDEHVDAHTTMKMGRGKLNPTGHGFVIILPSGERIYNAVDLALWIEREGLKLLS
jgi:hypothetical protein